MPEKTGYEKIKVEDIRQELIDIWGIAPNDELLKQTKTPLVKLLMKLQADQSQEEDEFDNVDGADDLVAPDLVAPAEPLVEQIFEAAEEDDDTGLIPMTEEDAKLVQPAYNSEGWSDYVMGRFWDDELTGENGAPTAAGCRRLAEELIGPILSETIPDHDAPTLNNNGTATVICGIQIKVTNEHHPACGEVIIAEDMAEVNEANCDLPYRKHPSATATTRAQGRIFRKLLRLRGHIITAEEESSAAETNDDLDWTPDNPITDAQISAINMMGQRMDIDVWDFINSGSVAYEELYHVKKSTASRMIKELNRIQRGIKEKPEALGNYNPNWLEEVTKK